MFVIAAMPRGAFSQHVLVSKFRVVNFVDSRVSTIIAELILPGSPGGDGATASASYPGSDISRSFAFTANFSRSYPALAAGLVQLVKLEPGCILERKEDSSEYVSLSCGASQEADLDSSKLTAHLSTVSRFSP